VVLCSQPNIHIPNFSVKDVKLHYASMRVSEFTIQRYISET
jgi:hypothetical protein